MSFNFKSLIERDKTINKLEFDVFSKIKELCKDDIEVEIKKNGIKTISFEDAIKELLDFKKKSH